jgi:hypothetical protein
MRKDIAHFVSLGPLPCDKSAEETIARYEAASRAMTPPLTREEASELAKCFGPDDCFGLAWTLLHLIESAPELALEDIPSTENEFVQRLRSALERAGAFDTRL